MTKPEGRPGRALLNVPELTPIQYTMTAAGEGSAAGMVSVPQNTLEMEMHHENIKQWN